MLFVFRGVRVFQVMLAAISIVVAVGCVLMVKTYADGGPVSLLVGAIILGMAFFWGFLTCLRAPTSFVAISDERTRIRFAGLVDTVIDNRIVLDAQLVKNPLWGGIGVRTNFSGTVTLATAFGTVCELTLSQPIRVWVIPKLLPVRGTKLRLSVRNPHKMVERFGKEGRAVAPSPAPGATRKMKQQRRR